MNVEDAIIFGLSVSDLVEWISVILLPVIAAYLLYTGFIKKKPLSVTEKIVLIGAILLVWAGGVFLS